MEVKITFDEVNVRDTQKINDIDIVMVKGEKGDVGYPTDEQVATAVDEWLTEHPEATTTVQDGSITLPKLANDVRAEIDTKADAIVKSASGSIASFSDGGDDLPMKSLKVNIVLKQSGSGDPSPSNVRPISGWDSVNVTRCGKNLFSLSMIEDSDFTLINGYYRSTKPVLKAGTYIWTGIDFSSSTSGLLVRFNDGSKILELVTRSAVVPTYERTFSNDAYIEFNYTKSGFLSTLNSFVGQLELGTTATATPYEPYQGNTYPISLPQTVYGGVLDVVSGKLVIDTGYIEFDGSSDETIYWNGNNALVILITRDGFKTDASTQNNVYTVNNMFADKSWAGRLSVDGTVGLYFGQPWIFLKYSQITDEATARTFLTSHPLQVAYKLQTPTEIQVTPTEVKTLLGSNNIWSESGTVEVEYRADSTLAYNELLSLIANL